MYASNPNDQYNTHAKVPRDWSTGLWDCFSDVPNCCLTTWCPCITFGRIAEILDQGSTSCGVTGTIYAVINTITGCGCLYSYTYRTKMRKQYNLPETPSGDFHVHFCYEPCALCQEYRELRNQGFDMSKGWQENVENQNGGVATAPVLQGGMRR